MRNAWFWVVAVLLSVVACGAIPEEIEERQAAETMPCPGLSQCYPPGALALRRGEAQIYSGYNYTGWCGKLTANNAGTASSEYNLAYWGWFSSPVSCFGWANPNGPYGTRVRSYKGGPDTAVALFSAASPDPTLFGNQTCVLDAKGQNEISNVDYYCATYYGQQGDLHEWASVRTKYPPTNFGVPPSKWVQCGGYGTTGTYWGGTDIGNLGQCGAPDSSGRWSRLCDGWGRGNCVWVQAPGLNTWTGYALSASNLWRLDHQGVQYLPMSDSAKMFGGYGIATIETGSHAQVQLCYSGTCQFVPENTTHWTNPWFPDNIKLFAW